jgi:hypothetical protein
MHARIMHRVQRAAASRMQRRQYDCDVEFLERALSGLELARSVVTRLFQPVAVEQVLYGARVGGGGLCLRGIPLLPEPGSAGIQRRAGQAQGVIVLALLLLQMSKQLSRQCFCV